MELINCPRHTPATYTVHTVATSVSVIASHFICLASSLRDVASSDRPLIRSQPSGSTRRRCLKNTPYKRAQPDNSHARNGRFNWTAGGAVLSGPPRPVDRLMAQSDFMCLLGSSRLMCMITHTHTFRLASTSIIALFYKWPSHCCETLGPHRGTHLCRSQQQQTRRPRRERILRLTIYARRAWIAPSSAHAHLRFVMPRVRCIRVCYVYTVAAAVAAAQSRAPRVCACAPTLAHRLAIRARLCPTVRMVIVITVRYSFFSSSSTSSVPPPPL